MICGGRDGGRLSPLKERGGSGQDAQMTDPFCIFGLAVPNLFGAVCPEGLSSQPAEDNNIPICDCGHSDTPGAGGWKHPLYPSK